MAQLFNMFAGCNKCFKYILYKHICVHNYAIRKYALNGRLDTAGERIHEVDVGKNFCNLLVIRIHPLL
jgi:hypothetical protein